MDQDRQTRLQTLLDPVHPPALRFCLRLCSTRPDAEDLYHDAILAAWHGLNDLKDDASFKPWFFRIIINTFRNRERRKRWLRFVPWTTTSEESESGEVLPEPGIDPRDALDARRWIEIALRVLSPNERALIVLFEIEEYTVAELAQIENVPKGTIKSKLSRARAKMRAALERFASAGETTAVHNEVKYALQPNPSATE